MTTCKRKYKVGDKVIIAEDAPQTYLPAGSTATITFVEPDTYEGNLIYMAETVSGKRDWLYDTDIADREEKAQYLVFAPDSNKVPTRWYFTHNQAKAVARKMCEEHGTAFYVLQATEKYTKGAVVKEEL